MLCKLLDLVAAKFCGNCASGLCRFTCCCTAPQCLLYWNTDKQGYSTWDFQKNKSDLIWKHISNAGFHFRLVTFGVKSITQYSLHCNIRIGLFRFTKLNVFDFEKELNVLMPNIKINLSFELTKVDYLNWPSKVQ